MHNSAPVSWFNTNDIFAPRATMDDISMPGIMSSILNTRILQDSLRACPSSCGTAAILEYNSLNPHETGRVHAGKAILIYQGRPRKSPIIKQVKVRFGFIWQGLESNTEQFLGEWTVIAPVVCGLLGFKSGTVFTRFIGTIRTSGCWILLIYIDEAVAP